MYIMYLIKIILLRPFQKKTLFETYQLKKRTKKVRKITSQTIYQKKMDVNQQNNGRNST